MKMNKILYLTKEIEEKRKGEVETFGAAFKAKEISGITMKQKAVLLQMILSQTATEAWEKIKKRPQYEKQIDEFFKDSKHNNIIIGCVHQKHHIKTVQDWFDGKKISTAAYENMFEVKAKEEPNRIKAARTDKEVRDGIIDDHLAMAYHNLRLHCCELEKELKKIANEN